MKTTVSLDGFIGDTYKDILDHAHEMLQGLFLDKKYGIETLDITWSTDPDMRGWYEGRIVATSEDVR